MKPKFALDLSHEGINLLHRSTGGWTLVGSVALDDPEMGTHLSQIRRKAAELESGGFTCKIIIPNSQILYTTLEAPGPDDIAREVQIRSGLDGLTPYPVGDLVFDWRADGERARVAVLARDTMDEAETFAVEYRFNPVSFVARPPQGEFSGEPFFGKTRAATKYLGPTERVEPDASPVPRRPRAMDPRPAAATAPGAAPQSAARPSPAGASAAPHPAPGSASGAYPTEPPVPEPLDAPLPDANPVDDPFAELDAIQAELSGDLSDVAPAFRSRASRNRNRPERTDRGADQPAPPPPLAPFPPTSDEAGALPAPPPPARRPRDSAKPAAKTPAPDSRSAPSRPQAAADAPRTDARTAADSDKAPARSWTPPETSRPAALDGAPPDTQIGEDDIPGTPGVAFSTRRAAGGTSITATPTARSAPPEAKPAAPPTPTPPSDPGARNAMAPIDRRRADMADALTRPLPGSTTKPGAAPEKPAEKPADAGTRTSLSGAMRGAAGGLRTFGQRRAARKEEPRPPESSMAELMRGAGSSEARISPDQLEDEPDLLSPEVARADDAPSEVSRSPAAAPETKPEPAPAPAPATEVAPKPAAKPASPIAPDIPKAKPHTPIAKPAKREGKADQAETLTVFGARHAQEKRGARRYLGLILTLLLLLVMAIIALWSSFFVGDGDTALFNPSEEQVAILPDADPTPGPTSPDAPAADPALQDDAALAPLDPEAAPEEALPDEIVPDSATPDAPDTAPTPQVLTLEEAEALYQESQIWQRAPETLAEPRTPGLDIAEVGGPGTSRAATAAPEPTDAPAAPAAPRSAQNRAAPLPPPPADTIFELDESGLVSPSPEGTVSPTGIIVFEGSPDVLPPVRPGNPPPPPEVPAEPAEPEAAAPEAIAPEAAPVVPATLPDATEVAASITDVAPRDTGPAPDDVETAALDAATAATPDAALPEDAADADAAPSADVTAVTAAADAAAIDAAVDAAAANIVDPGEFAVAASTKPAPRPADIDQIVEAAMARAAATAPPAVAAPATTTPTIPTSASVATQATTPDALNLREINLLGISGPTNALKALVRLPNGSLATVKVGDRLDGGRVTSITSDGLTYQKGSRNLSLQLLPLG